MNTPTPLRAPRFTDNSRNIFDRRYPRKNVEGKPAETPEETIWRVASNVGSIAGLYGPNKVSRGIGESERFPYKTAQRQHLWRSRQDGVLEVEFASALDYPAMEKQSILYYDLIASWDFLPNSPTWTGAGTPLGQLAACFVLPIDDDLASGRGSIFETMKVAALIQQTGGGNGFSFGDLRPNDSLVNRSMGRASGPVGFLKAYDASFGVIAQGGSRRGANMGVLPVHHPDIEAFIEAKVVEGEVENFNISIALTDEFMEAVEKDGDFDLRWGLAGPTDDPVTYKISRTIRARDLWDKIAQNAWVIGDPGNLFIDRANRDNPCPHKYVLKATNPCITGDTLIAVADGRGAVSIKDLADAGNDVPVYAYNRETGATEVATGLNPRVTGYDQQIYEVRLNNGTSFKVTGNHKFILRDGTEREAQDLRFGDSLLPFSRWASTYNATSNHYWFVSNGFRTKHAEHRLIADHVLGEGHGKHVHHQDYDGLNNLWENLVPVTDVEHRAIHDVRGDHNPMYGKTHSADTKRKIGSKSRGRSHNLGRQHTETTKALLSEKATARANDPVVKSCEWCGAQMMVPYGRREQGYCSHSCLSHALAHKVDVIEARAATRDVSRDAKRQRQVEVFIDLHQRLDRDPLKKEWEDECRERGVPFRLAPPSAQHHGTFGTFAEVKEAALIHNHRVVEVTPLGTETVYNLTVADHHNYAIVAEVPRHGKPIDGVTTTLSGVFTTQCGEQWLGPYENCCLGSINLANFADWDGTFDWPRFAKVIDLSTRFLDDVVDANQYVPGVPELEEAAQGGRRIGLGLMGLGDAMVKMGVRYGSEEGLEFASQVTEFARYHTMLTSIARAKTRGPFGWFKGSIYDFDGPGTFEGLDGKMHDRWTPPTPMVSHDLSRWDRPDLDWDGVVAGIKQYGIRNSCQFTFAPTGTISNVAALEGSGCEPLFALVYYRTVVEGEGDVVLAYASPLFRTAMLAYPGIDDEALQRAVDAVAANNGSCQGLPYDVVPLAIQHIFAVAADVTWEEHVRTQAVLQRFVDNSISKTINMPNSATVEDVAAAYRMAYDLGCKGITIYRQGSRDREVLATSKKVEDDSPFQMTEEAWPQIHPLKIPDYASDTGLVARIFPVTTAFGKVQVTITELDEHPGRPFDIRLQLGKAGNDKNADVEAIGRMISLALRSGVAVSEVIEQLEGIGGQTFTGFGPGRVRSAPDGIAKLLKRRYLDTGDGDVSNSITETIKVLPVGTLPGADPERTCPRCLQASIVVESGCSHCDIRLGGCGDWEGCD